MTPQPATVQAVSESCEVRLAAADRRALFYQFGGSSNRGLPMAPEEVAAGLAVEKLKPSRVARAVDEADFDADAQAAGDPQ